MSTENDLPRRHRRTVQFQPPPPIVQREEVEPPPPKAVLAPCPRWLQVAAFLYATLLLALSTINLLGSDRWWWSALNQYLPQWVWGLVPVALVPIYLKQCRRAIWMPIGMILWVLIPIMDFRFALIRPTTVDQKGTYLRLMTYNVKNGHYGHSQMTHTIEEANADIILLQQAHGTYKDELVTYLNKYHVQRVDQYIFASKFPILESSIQDLSVLPMHLVALRCKLAIGTRIATVYSVHLLSPRNGISGIRKSSEIMYWNNRIRQIQGYRLAEYLRHEWGPVLLAGDLNTPVQSSLSEHLSDVNLYNAFNLVGRGYGYTYGHTLPLRHSFARIDHIYLSRDWVALNCFTGSAEGSDHRPLIADLFLPEH